VYQTSPWDRAESSLSLTLLFKETGNVYYSIFCQRQFWCTCTSYVLPFICKQEQACATKANQQFMFQNNFQQSFNPGSFSGDPSPPTTARPDLPNTTTTIVEKMSKAFPYPPIPHSKPSNPIPNLTTNKPFVYTHSIPSHEDLQDPSTSMLTTDYNHDQREDIVHPPSGWGVLPRDRDSERSGHRPWRRRVDEYVQ